MVEKAKSGMMLVDADGRLLFNAQDLGVLSGVSTAARGGQSVFEIFEFHPDDLERCRAALRECAGKAGAVVRVGYRIKRGEAWRFAEATLTNYLDDPDIGGILNNYHDVTERHEAEEALRKSQKFYKALIEKSHGAMVLYAADGRLLFHSHPVSVLSGLPTKDLVGNFNWDLVHPDDVKPLKAAVADVVSRGQGASAKIVVRWRRGHENWQVSESTMTNQLEDPDIQGIVTNMRDVTELWEAQEDLRRNEKRFRAMVEKNAEYMALLNEDGSLFYFNQTHGLLSDLPIQDFFGRESFERIHPEDKAAAGELIEAVKARPGQSLDLEFRARDAQGSWRWIAGSLTNRLQDPDLKALVANYRDITLLKEAQARQLREERLAAVGQAVASLASEIKRPSGASSRTAQLLRAKLAEEYAREYLFLKDPAMKRVYEKIGRVADKEQVSVLIQGETGTGKEHVARLLHHFSPRASKPFIELHCAALPESLLESELFGYEAGAFTDAKRRKPGLFEAAQGSTLLLDEVGELPLSTQTKLLKVLEQKTMRRLGGMEAIQLDVRLVCATNRDLQAEIKAGRFRSDLYYRLNVFNISLPPLRARPMDIVGLSRFFFEQACQGFGKELEALSEPVLADLKARAWSGNVRELKNFVERLVIECDGPRVELDDLEPEPARPEALSAQEGVRLNKDGLARALKAYDGNKSRAAYALGISRDTLYRKIKEWKIS
jgi:PAS domain S-box-containing protein